VALTSTVYLERGLTVKVSCCEPPPLNMNIASTLAVLADGFATHRYSWNPLPV
jgi:hypothetical protein